MHRLHLGDLSVSSELLLLVPSLCSRLSQVYRFDFGGGAVLVAVSELT